MITALGSLGFRAYLACDDCENDIEDSDDTAVTLEGADYRDDYEVHLHKACYNRLSLTHVTDNDIICWLLWDKYGKDSF